MSPFGGLGVAVGTVFPSRAAVRNAGLHRHLMRGIAGRAEEGADAIVMSGGYDDIDRGDEIIYTGEGGLDQNGKNIADQDLTGGNAALVTSQLDGLPVRVIRGSELHSPFAPESGYRYDGLFYVEDHWHDRPVEHGYLRYRYRLVRASDDGATLLALPDPPPDAPPRVPTTVQRLVRSTEVANAVKAIHQHRCQICGAHIDLGNGRSYSEAAHIRPLGLPHNGPDSSTNVLCLCPNDHVRFDYGALFITDQGEVMDAATGEMTGQLRTHPAHQIGAEHLAYHRTHWAGASRS
jgi:putative restriction endonuclease